MQGEAIDIEEALESVETHTPYILAFGATQEHLLDIKVIIERENVLPMPSVATALHFCFSAYSVFNISFPQTPSLIVIFLEKYVYGLKPSQKPPLSATVLYDSLQKVLIE